MLRDPIEAEDLAQETFLLVFRKMHTFRGEAAFSSWLYRLTVNTVLMSFRRKTHVLASLDELMTDWENGGLPEIAKPDMTLSGLFDRLNLDAAIDLLPSGCKAAFILHDVEGYEHREVATILGCSIGNSKSQLHRARRRLRKLLHYVPDEKYGTNAKASCNLSQNQLANRDSRWGRRQELTLASNRSIAVKAVQRVRPSGRKTVGHAKAAKMSFEFREKSVVRSSASEAQ